jgi:general secretion pathway protein M
MSGLFAWWTARSQREQLLLGVMTALLAFVFAVYGVAKPMIAAQAKAEARLASAILADEGVSRQIAALQSRRPATGGASADQPLAQLVEQSASDAGFQPGTATPQGEDRVALTIPAARARPLFAWLVTLEKQGVFVDQAQLATKSDGGLTATLSLRRRGS